MNDQKRVMSYADFTKTADSKCFAVIGRPIIEGDPVQNIKKIIQWYNLLLDFGQYNFELTEEEKPSNTRKK